MPWMQNLFPTTTAGDFCRRFPRIDVLDLTYVITSTRPRVCDQQTVDFFDHGRIDMDGTLVPTDAECKEGVDIAYNDLGLSSLVVSLANTRSPVPAQSPRQPPLASVAASSLDRAVNVCLHAGFRSLFVRVNTHFTQTKHLDRWICRRPLLPLWYRCPARWRHWPINCRPPRTTSRSGRYL